TAHVGRGALDGRPGGAGLSRRHGMDRRASQAWTGDLRQGKASLQPCPPQRTMVDFDAGTAPAHPRRMLLDAGSVTLWEAQGNVCEERLTAGAATRVSRQDR